MERENPSAERPLKIGTRGSPLALAQANETRLRLVHAHGFSGDAIEINVISTEGDRIQDRALREVGGKGLFTREIEVQLLEGTIDIAVHSSKDMPVEQPAGLVLDCFLPREDVRDAFVSTKHDSIDDLPDGAVVGTSSLRRKAQLLHKRPDLEVVEFRGNVQTRLKKLEAGVAEATFLASAGLRRLEASDVPARPVSPDDMLPAIAQGAIGIERRADDTRMSAFLAAIHDEETGLRVRIERAFMAALDGSCQTPIAGLAELNGDMVRFRGEILRTDGSQALADEVLCHVSKGEDAARDMADRLLDQAGDGFFDWR